MFSGSFESCGSHYSVDPVLMTINPLELTNISFWSADFTPHVTWTPDAGKTYAMFIWDGGAVLPHGLMINIPGGRLDEGQVGKSIGVNF